MTDVRKFAVLSLATYASMVRERCCLLEGKAATQQIEQLPENRSDNCILGTIIMRSHTFMTKNSNQHSSPGSRMAGHEAT